MKLQISTNYAIRILQYLHEHQWELPTAMTVSKAVGMSYSFFIKIANQLKHKGLIETVQGRNGGYRLAKNGAAISLYDVILAIEGKLHINRCLEKDRFCSRDNADTCVIRNYFDGVQDTLIQELSSKRIADLAS